jgi:hypothetical protein
MQASAGDSLMLACEDMEMEEIEVTDDFDDPEDDEDASDALLPVEEENFEDSEEEIFDADPGA